MRVVLLDTSNPDEMTGGQSVFIRNLIPRLEADVAVVGAASGSEPLGVWQRRSLHGSEYYFLPVARMPQPGRPPLVPLRLTSCLGVAVFRRRILDAGDVMYVHSPEMGLPLAVGSGRKPMVLHVHGAANPLTASRYRWARASVLRAAYGVVQRLVIRNSAHVLSVDEAGLVMARGHRAHKSRTGLTLLPICVDMDLFCPGDTAAARAELGLSAEARILLFVGRLEAAKGTARLIEALGELATRDARVRLVVIGDGSQRPDMERASGALGVSDKVVFSGWVDHDRLPRYLQAADALLLPSDYEGLPTVVVEAMACGVPVVATDVGGLGGLIKEGQNGLLLKSVTSHALAAATEQVLDRTWPTDEVRASVGEYSAAYVAAQVTDVLRRAYAC